MAKKRSKQPKKKLWHITIPVATGNKQLLVVSRRKKNLIKLVHDQVPEGTTGEQVVCARVKLKNKSVVASIDKIVKQEA